MEVPDYQSLIRSVLEGHVATGTMSTQELVNWLEKNRLVDRAVVGEKKNRLQQRLSWARHQLVLAGLVSREGHGLTRITDAGREVAQDGPERIDVSYLRTVNPQQFGGHLRYWASLHEAFSAGKYAWPFVVSARQQISRSLGPGAYLQIAATKTTTRVQVALDHGPGSNNENLNRFNSLFSRRSDIELDIGRELEWLALPTRRQCRILAEVPGGYEAKRGATTPFKDITTLAAKFDATLRPSLQSKHHVSN